MSGIITLITTIILAKQSQFDSTVLLRSLAYEVALSIRQAQIYGLSVRETAAGSGDFDTGYGVYFSSASPTSYILFADADHDGVYDGESESVEVFSVRRGYRISSFCATLGSGVERCSPTELSYLAISFERPDPDAQIKSDLGNDVYGSARVIVLAPDGVSTRVIEVESTGQIAVESE